MYKIVLTVEGQHYKWDGESGYPNESFWKAKSYKTYSEALVDSQELLTKTVRKCIQGNDGSLHKNTFSVEEIEIWSLDEESTENLPDKILIIV